MKDDSLDREARFGEMVFLCEFRGVLSEDRVGGSSSSLKDSSTMKSER